MWRELKRIAFSEKKINVKWLRDKTSLTTVHFSSSASSPSSPSSPLGLIIPAGL